MLKALRNSRKDNEGFSLVELLVVLLIMSIIAGIAVPLYLNQKQRAYLSLAQADATAIGQEITSILSDYTSLGTLAGTITISGGVLVFGGMTSATGNGTANTTAGAGLSGPLTTTSTVRINAASTISSSNWDLLGAMKWCIVVTNNGTYAKYNGSGTGAAGLTLSQIGGTAPTCTLGV